MNEALLATIELTDAETSDYTGIHKKPPEPESLRVGITTYLDELNALGWVVELYDDEIYLFQHFKNGRQRKTATLYLAYFVDPDQVRTLKPWKTGSLSYKYFERALAVFLQADREMEPG